MQQTITPPSLASMLPSGGFTYVQACSGESRVLADALRGAGDALGAMTFCGIFAPGLNTYDYLPNPECRVLTYFMTPELKRAGGAVDFRPLCYADILTDLRGRKIDAALVMLSPPDEDGFCSFGPVVDFLPELWENIPAIIGHINPSLPRTRGRKGIPFTRLSAFVEADQPLLEHGDDGEDEVSREIAGRIAPLVPNRATLQVGLGKIPNATLRALTSHKGLKIHSGLICDAVLDLLDAGALAGGVSVTGGVAIGGRRLYEACGGPAFQFLPVSHTHAPRVLGNIENFVSINSALEVDLFGQAYAECGPKGLMSGPGGASDFARGARLGGGLRVVALPATAMGGGKSRIVAPGQATGPVSLGRMEVDCVVTEYGCADLRLRGHEERAGALIAISAPGHRQSLREAWAQAATILKGGEAR